MELFNDVEAAIEPNCSKEAAGEIGTEVTFFTAIIESLGQL